MYAKEYTIGELSQIGVYRIITPSGGIYVGMTTVSFIKRWKGHHKGLKNGKHKCQGLKNSYDYYNKDWDLFQCEIIKSWDKTNDKEMLKILQREILIEEKLSWIRHKNSGYQMIHGCPTGTGSVLHSKASRNKTSNTIKNTFKIRYDSRFIENYEAILFQAKSHEYSLDKIARNFRIEKEYLRYLFIKNNIIFNEKLNKQQKLLLVKDEILDLYFNEVKSTHDIAKIYNTDQPSISNLFKFLKSINYDERLLNIKERERRIIEPFSEEVLTRRSETYKKNNIKILCEYCKKEISKNVFEKHQNSCKTWPKCLDCGKKLSKKGPKYCKEHFRNH